MAGVKCSQCNAWALRRSSPPLCYFHAPSLAEARQQARILGGKARHTKDSVESAIKLAENAMSDLAEGRIDAEKAKVIGRLAELVIYGDESRNLKERLRHATR
jgi:hypothetical protein